MRTVILHVFFNKNTFTKKITGVSIKHMNSAANLINHLEAKVYRKEALMPYTKAVVRNLKSLSNSGIFFARFPGRIKISGTIYSTKIGYFESRSKMGHIRNSHE
jgi:hypothetical protein